MKNAIYFILLILLFSCNGNHSTQNIKPGNLEFYETYFPSEISQEWKQACIKSLNFENDEINAKDTLSENLNNLKGLADYVKNVGEYAVGFVSEKDKILVDSLLQREDIKSTFPKDLRFMWSAKTEKNNYQTKEEGYTLYAIKIPLNGKALVDGKDVKNATTGFDTQSSIITVDITMTEDGSYTWADMTTANVNRIIAITMDNKVYSAPRVMSMITGGKTQISGSFTEQEASDLTARINTKK